MNGHERIRAAALVGLFSALLAIGGCASPTNGDVATINPDKLFPVTAAPAFKTLELSFGTPSGGLLPQDETRFDGFVQAYLARGNGSISISVPKGPGSTEAIRYFGERLAAMGVPRSSILVGARTLHDGDPRVELAFITYKADAPACGDWSKNVADTASNLPMPNFGCANEHNLAAMVADPRDLVEPRNMGPSDATRRSTVLDNYEAGKPTAAQKTSDQTSNVSGIQ